MSKELKCVGDNILIKLPEVSEKTEGGIIKSEEMLQEEEKEHNIVEVVDVGEDVSKVKVGDKVMLNSPRVYIHNYKDVRYGGIKEYDVFCVVKG